MMKNVILKGIIMYIYTLLIYLWNIFLRINFISQNKSFCLHKVSQKSLISNLHFI